MAQHQHRFAVGQVVNFLPGSADGNVRRGQYTIQRLLPSEFQRAERARLKQAKQDAKWQERAAVDAARREAERQPSLASSELHPDAARQASPPPAGRDEG
jgi:hypothetical protein